MGQALFVTLADVKKFTHLNGSIDSDRLIQSIKVAQDIEIQTYLGHDLFTKINDDIVASTLISPYTTLLSDYIKPMLIWYAFSDYLSFGAYHISNKGIYKATNEVGETIDSNEVDKLIAKARDNAEHYTQRFINYICNNSATYPEYNTNSNGEMTPSKDNNFSGWYL